VTTETLVAASGDRVPGGGAAIFDDGSTRVAVWRWPRDPFLPGLADAIDAAKVGRLLDEVGVDGGALQLRTRAYRPGRRAVIEATGRRGRLFLKVVRPHRVEALHDRHRRLASALPVPDSIGWRDDGIVVLTARPGRTLRDALRTSDHTPPPPGAITALLDRLPPELAEATERRDLVSSAEHHAEVIASTVPAARGHVEALIAELHELQRETALPVTAVHGDLYEAQLLVDRGRVTGLLDIDTAGSGLRIDDLANFCAHLSVLALVSERPRHIKRYGAALLTHAEQHRNPFELRRRIAAAAIGLATGPFRVLEPNWPPNTLRRLELATDWLASATTAR